MNLRSFRLPGMGVLMLLAAACGSAAAGVGYAGQHAASAPAVAGDAIQLRMAPLGRILVDRQGRTLYLFEKDAGGSSSCYGACASIWPPLTTTAAPKAAGGLTRPLGTTKRSDGTTQVTYNGHPLYTYAGDSAAGQTNGEGLDQYGGGWDVLAPDGDKIESDG